MAKFIKVTRTEQTAYGSHRKHDEFINVDRIIKFCPPYADKVSYSALVTLAGYDKPLSVTEPPEQILALINSNAFKERDDIEDGLRSLETSARALLDALKEFGFSPEINDAFLDLHKTLSDIEGLT